MESYSDILLYVSWAVKQWSDLEFTKVNLSHSYLPWQTANLPWPTFRSAHCSTKKNHSLKKKVCRFCFTKSYPKKNRYKIYKVKLHLKSVYVLFKQNSISEYTIWSPWRICTFTGQYNDNGLTWMLVKVNWLLAKAGMNGKDSSL